MGYAENAVEILTAVPGGTAEMAIARAQVYALLHIGDQFRRLADAIWEEIERGA